MSRQEVATAEADPKTDALKSFERWSNYLLVTTVAAAGWVSSQSVSFEPEVLKSVTLGCFGVAIIFGIFTLALVPLIAQTMTKSDSSIHKVNVHFFLFGRDWYVYLTQACRPQHASFIVGIAFYCIGTVGRLVACCGGSDCRTGAGTALWAAALRNTANNIARLRGQTNMAHAQREASWRPETITDAIRTA